MLIKRNVNWFMSWEPRKQVVVILTIIVIVLASAVLTLWGANAGLNKSLDNCRVKSEQAFQDANNKYEYLLLERAKQDKQNAEDWMNSAKRLERMKDSVDIINKKIERLINRKKR